MAIINVTGMWSNAEGQLQKESNAFTEKFSVLSDELLADRVEVMTHPDVPAIGESHSDQPSYFAKRIWISEQRGPLYEVTVEYFRQNGPNGEEDPALAEVEITGGSTSRVEPFDCAYDPANLSSTARTTRVTNSALQPFDPPLADEVYDMQLRYRRVDISIDFMQIRKYFGAVNLDTFDGFAPGTCKIIDIEFERFQFANDWRWRKTYIIAIREPLPVVTQSLGPLSEGGPALEIGGAERAWWRRVMDMGFDEMALEGGPPVRVWNSIKDKDLNRVAAAVPLDGIGQKKEEGVIWFEYRTARHLPFANLGIFG